MICKERGIPDVQPVVDEHAPQFHVRANAPPLYLIIGDRELEMLGRCEEKCMHVANDEAFRPTVNHTL